VSIIEFLSNNPNANQIEAYIEEEARRIAEERKGPHGVKK